MSVAHAKAADWGVSHLEGLNPAEIVELGCGSGRNAGALLRKYPSAKVTGIDYSPLSVEQARTYNRDMVAAGRCAVQEGDVSNLTLEEGKFDLATAFETIYFWPGLTWCFAEVARILRPGGHFMIVNESDGMDDLSLKFEKIIDGMKNHTSEEIETALGAAGFSEVKTSHHPHKPWITVLAKK